MSLATFDQANRWLDESKAKFNDDDDAFPESSSADALVLASLADVYPDDYATWDAETSGTETPPIVAYIASRLMAAYRYGKLYSMQDRARADYAKWLEDGALSLLQQLRDGIILIPEIALVSPVDFGAADFYPNDATEILEPGEARKFSMGMCL